MFTILLCKAKRQYLLTLWVSRYWRLALQTSIEDTFFGCYKYPMDIYLDYHSGWWSCWRMETECTRGWTDLCRTISVVHGSWSGCGSHQPSGSSRLRWRNSAPLRPRQQKITYLFSNKEYNVCFNIVSYYSYYLYCESTSDICALILKTSHMQFSLKNRIKLLIFVPSQQTQNTCIPFARCSTLGRRCTLHVVLAGICSRIAHLSKVHKFSK